MGRDDKPRHVPALSSLPPVTEEIDTNWDDEPHGAPGEDPSPSPFDRITVVPSRHADLAARMMDESEAPLADPLTPPKVPVFRAGEMPELPREPPPLSTERERAPPLPDDVLPPHHEETLRDWPAPDPFEPSRSPEPWREQGRQAPDRRGASGGYAYGRGAVYDRATGLELADDFEAPSGPPESLDGEASIPLGRSDPVDFGAFTRPTPRESVRSEAKTPRAGDSEPATPRISAPAPDTPRAPGLGPARPGDEGPVADMKDRYAVGDFTGALVIAESILEAQPEQPEARRYAQSCREVLTQMYAARLGSLSQIATVAIPADQIRWLSLDHRAGFLLSLVDGICTLEEILDVSGMSRLDALRIMFTLVQQRVISLEATSSR